jgi:hypothetical protein
MDTNINNYDTIELLDVLKIPNHKEPNLLEIYNSAKNIIKQLKTKKHLENKDELIVFFKHALEKVTKDLSLRVPKDMMDNLIDESKYDTLPDPRKDRFYQPPIVKEQIYPGAIPPQIPNPIAFHTSTTHNPRGLVNPLKKETVKSIITIHSKFRNASNTIIKKENPDAISSSLTTDFTVDLNEPYNNVIGIKLAGCELMNGYYPFSEYLKTNQFSITVFTLDVNGIRGNQQIFPLTFVEGTYTATQISQLITRTINSSLGDITGSGWAPLVEISPGNYTPQVQIPPLLLLEYNSIKGKFYFRKNENIAPPIVYPTGNGATSNVNYPNIVEASTGNVIDWGFDIDFRISSDPTRDIEKNFGWLCGFQKPIYYYENDYILPSNTNMIFLEGYNPEAILDFTGTKFFLLEITDYNKNYSEVFKYNTHKRNINYKDILARIPNTVLTTDIIFEDSSDRIFKTRKYLGPVRISKLRIRLLDDFGRVVNLNGGDLIITLEIETLDMPYKNFRQ